MIKKRKQLSNAFSTGGGGHHFEAHVQASFVSLMLTFGRAPCLPSWPIVEIILQGKVHGYSTDDLVVCVEEPVSHERRKLIAQIKHSIQITEGNATISDVMKACWDDVNDAQLFAKKKDIVALITGPLNTTDAHNVQWLLNQARCTKDADEFYLKVGRAKYAPTKAREKLNVFRHHLQTANNGSALTDETLYSFLHDFHLLGYDLGNEAGVVLSLLHSHIAQFEQSRPAWLWSRVVDFVQTRNKDGGTITRDNLPDDLKEAFRQSAVSHQPYALVAKQPEPGGVDWSQQDCANDLALVNLVGAWTDPNPADVDALQSIVNENYATLAVKLRNILQLKDSPLSLKNGLWKVMGRSDLWQALGSRIFDAHLKAFKQTAVSILTERDPAFDMPAGKRYMAKMDGKVLAHSTALRKGVVETLALLGTRGEALSHCSLSKAEETAILAVRSVFANADWKLWASLNELLAGLAEAAPNEFLRATEDTLRLQPCPFDELFSQEGDGITGTNYLAGLLWALEGLAWDEEYLVPICLILGELATHDPGGKWANRPDNSLSKILLPWMPQTMASVEKRRVAVKTLCKEWPDVSWKVIMSLLPNQLRVSSGSHKPNWRGNVPRDYKPSVTNAEYWGEISIYAELAISMARADTAKLAELLDCLSDLPKASTNELLTHLSSVEVSNLSEDERLPLWRKLTALIAKNRRFATAKWAMSEEDLGAIERVADVLAPSDPVRLYKPLFSGRDSDFHDGIGDWDEQQRKLDERRVNALRELLKTLGTSAVLAFAQEVDAPGQVGHALALLADQNLDDAVLPACLNGNDRARAAFVNGYLWTRSRVHGSSWMEHLQPDRWSKEQITSFLVGLPFTNETWERAALWLGDSQQDYWRNATINIYQTHGDPTVAVDKLVQNGRPCAAIDYLHMMRRPEQPFDVALCLKALDAAIDSPEAVDSMHAYHTVELIKSLQKDPTVDPDDLFRVEWAYLSLLDLNDASPKSIEARLSAEPSLFCDLIRLMYRPDLPTVEERKPTDAEIIGQEPTEQEKKLATHAWQLLKHWHRPPGMKEDGTFSGVDFRSWLQDVKGISAESGHLSVALINVGEVLTHTPPDPSGLWIDYAAAEALNALDAEDMRRGFRTALFNARGVHWVDPSAAPERQLAVDYRRKAEDVENVGYARLAVVLRNLADGYDLEAKRILDEGKGMGQIGDTTADE